MKKIKSLTNIAILIICVFVAHAAFAAPLLTSTVSQDASSVTVNYHYAGTPSETIKVYSWLGVANSSTWIDRSNLLITIPQSSSQVTKDFSVTYNFAALGLAGNGTKYVYYAADGTTDQSLLFTGPGYFTVGTAQASPSQPPAASQSSAGPACAPGPFTTASQPASLCTAGTANAINNSTAHWTWQCELIPYNSVPCSAAVTTPPAGTISGVTIKYLDGHSIMNTTADIPVLVSVTAPTNVNLSVYMALTGQSFQNSQPLLVQTMTPASPKNTAIHFAGLTPGTSYYFSIKNEVTGSYSDPVQFTTTGGINPSGGTIGVTGADGAATVSSGTVSAGTTAITDTISDKGIVPKCGRTEGEGTQMCTFKDFMQLVANVIQYGLILLFIFFTIMFLYIGAMMIYLGGVTDKTTDQMKKLKGYGKTLLRIVIGLAIIATAWTVISTILIALGVQHQYILLDIFSGR